VAAPPVFIVGAPRSGTTLLRRLLNAHPELHLTFEASFFAVVKAMPPPLAESNFREAWVRSLPFVWQRVPDADLPVAAPVGLSPRDPRWFEALMRYCAQRAGKSRWGDKTPLHVYELDALFAAFPNARVVHIVRDPVAVVRSLQTVPWGSQNLFACSLAVRAALDAVRPFRSRIHEVRLEDLLADREGVLRETLAYCDLPWSDHVLDPDHHAPVDVPPLPWLSTRAADRAQLPVRSTLVPADAYRLSRITAPQRERYGYAPVPHAGRTLGGHVARAVQDLRELADLARSLMELQRVARRWPAAPEAFDAISTLHPGAALACSVAERQRFVDWLSTPGDLG
jgi:hypothetical protein